MVCVFFAFIVYCYIAIGAQFGTNGIIWAVVILLVCLVIALIVRGSSDRGSGGPPEHDTRGGPGMGGDSSSGSGCGHGCSCH